MPPTPKQKPAFFKTPADFRAWLEKHHTSKTELVVGFYKKDSGKPSITWPESVDQALCFGWIDGIRRNAGEDAYTIRFTPRKPTSNWSAINIARVAELTKQKLMRAAGAKAFEARRADRSGIYAYENRTAELPDAYAAVLKRNVRAWTYFQNETPGYRKQTMWWIVSAKREATRLKRVTELCDFCARGRRLPRLERTPPKGKR